ncbi:MAG: hypothetical protein E7316_07130 [Clostridiales bacterium]|nr:hypothetical protein [Clostridiales bacterium]
MAYYCGECIVWRGSSDENKYGERWCSYSRRYERSDQNTYGCNGFIYAGRAILTKVCQILQLDTQEWFAAYDKVKEAYLVPAHMDMLVSYCEIGPALVEKIDMDEEKDSIAYHLLNCYLTPAMQMSQTECFKQAVEKYKDMVSMLVQRYLMNHYK